MFLRVSFLFFPKKNIKPQSEKKQKQKKNKCSQQSVRGCGSEKSMSHSNHGLTYSQSQPVFKTMIDMSRCYVPNDGNLTEEKTDVVYIASNPQATRSYTHLPGTMSAPTPYPANRSPMYHTHLTPYNTAVTHNSNNHPRASHIYKYQSHSSFMNSFVCVCVFLVKTRAFRTNFFFF